MTEHLIALQNALRSESTLEALGLAARHTIIARTLKGISVDGTAFRQYSPGYSKKRARHDLPVSPVNLMWDDSEKGMLNSITHTVFQDLSGLELFIGDAQKALIASYHNDLGAGRSKVIRHFWALSEDELNALSKITDEQIEKVLQMQNLK